MDATVDRSRRRLLAALAASTLLLSCHRLPTGRQPPWRIGLALGGGGIKGLAHVPMLETFDRLGIRPACLAGTSIGAVFGAMYAAGLSGKEIRRIVRDLLIGDGEGFGALFGKPRLLDWIQLFSLHLGDGGLLSSDGFIDWLKGVIPARRFEDLKIPLRIVAGDVNTSEQVVFASGGLFDAIRASIALPGIFPPVRLNGRFLVDGGVVNPVPFDVLRADCDVVVAIDVTGSGNPIDEEASFLEVIFQSFHVLETRIVHEKLASERPDIYIKPDLHGVRMLELYKAEEVFEQAGPAVRRLEQALSRFAKSRSRPGCAMSEGVPA